MSTEDKEPRLILNRPQLLALARELGVRPDWHEPDEQGLEAIVFGEEFDNAGFWGRSFRESILSRHPKHRLSEEMNIMLVKDGKPIAEINLASLFAMACGCEGT